MGVRLAPPIIVIVHSADTIIRVINSDYGILVRVLRKVYWKCMLNFCNCEQLDSDGGALSQAAGHDGSFLWIHLYAV